MQQKTLLLIQNQLDLRMVYAAIFSYGRYAIDVATTNEEALKKLKQTAWDVVLLGMTHLSGIDGFDLLETYNSDPVYTTAKKHSVFIAIVDDEDVGSQLHKLVDEVFIMGKF